MKIQIKSILTLAAMAAVGVTSASATMVINFGGDYVNANQAGSRSWTGGGGGNYVVTYNDSSALSPTSGYNGTTYYGAGFRGNWTLSAAGNTNVVSAADGTNDAIQFDNGSGTSAVDTGFAGLVYFKKTNFSGGGDSNQVNITSNSSFTARGTNAQNTGALEVRWVLQLADLSYAISAANPSTFGNSNSYTNITSGDLTSLNWFSYDPSTSIMGIGSNKTMTFTDIRQVGVWFGDTTNSVNARYQGRLSGFTADVTVVPEPATWALLAGGLTALVVFRRRNRQS